MVCTVVVKWGKGKQQGVNTSANMLRFLKLPLLSPKRFMSFYSDRLFHGEHGAEAYGTGPHVTQLVPLYCNPRHEPGEGSFFDACAASQNDSQL